MKISTKGRYGARAMLELALRPVKNPVLIRDISEAQDISEKYLERIFSVLKNSGLVKSRRGKNGGYILALPAAKIKLIQIITALEGPLAPVECVEKPEVCKRVSKCITHDIWKKISDSTKNILSGITLEDMVQAHKIKNKQAAKMYYI